MLQKKHLSLPLAGLALGISLALSGCGGDDSSSAGTNPGNTTPSTPVSAQDALTTATPIKHVVVIFSENESFDHYFGTYPKAANPKGEPTFTAAAGTPTVNGLSSALLNNNPNASNSANGVNAVNPFRLDRSQANTEGQNHAYTAEQLAYNNGAADLFPKYTGNNTVSSTGAFGTHGLVMGYFDGNTVTALWNYAQHFAMSDNTYTNDYGPSTPGALGIVAGTTNGAVNGVGKTSTIPDGQGGLTLVNDTDPTGDVCSAKNSQVSMTSKNIGDLLNAKQITWGGFMGGFDLTATNPNGTTGCTRSSYSAVLGATKVDYIPHHAWFQYYPSTANPAHTRPTSVAQIGATDDKDNSTTPVHHQYDLNDFFAAVKAGNFPSVSYLKAPAIQDAHPGNSDPLDEQAFITKVVNFLEQQPDWKNTAVIVTYDDSDGWYDHAYTPPTTSSFDSTTKQDGVIGADQLNGPGVCNAAGASQGVGVNGGVVNGRCGPGTRIPLLVISPYAKANYVDHNLLTQASVIRFIEDNWLGGARLGGGSDDAKAGSLMSLFDFSASGGNTPSLYLDSDQGTVLSAPPAN